MTIAQQTFDCLATMNAYIAVCERALANLALEQRNTPGVIDDRATEILERLYDARKLRDRLVAAAEAVIKP